MNKKLIGKRLAALRDELAGPGEKKWTIAMVAEETGLTQNMVGQMERSGAGGIEIFISYLLFFYRRGYNLNWIILPDNASVSKKRLEEDVKTIDMRSVANQFQYMREAIEREIDTAFKALEA
ncbi:hypothetical protein [Hymenobacter radiodurans]|uniref:hypothetical protein n=1 Tax=Hymenobacter radiodurans TaxID=2496028 RepID=UPI00105905F9|nr:hypothetical protein [Hymenobacter radiodurans]